MYQAIAAGTTYTFGAGMADYWILKLASDGSINFNATSGASTTATSATVTTTLVTGETTSATVTDTNAAAAVTSAAATDTNATVTVQAP